jgi:hypothetical protein
MNYFQKHNSLLFFMKFSAWLLFFLLVLEIFSRNFIMKYPSEHFIQGLGNVAIDNSVTVNGIEGFAVTHYLANGEIVTPYQSGVSVVVLGDSFTEAEQVSDDEKYVSVAENILHERGLAMDLRNLGRAGRSLPDYIYIAPFIKRTYSPAVVVVQLEPLDFLESFDKTKENYFVRNGMSVELMHNEIFSSNQMVLRNILRSTSFGSLVRYKFKSIDLILEKQHQLIATDMPESDASISETEGFDPNDIGMQINALKDAYSDVKLVILVIPGVPTIKKSGLVWDNTADDELIKIFEGIPGLRVLYPRDGFIELYTADKKFPFGFSNTLPNTGHLNSDGHFVVGTALTTYLEEITK